MNKLFEFLRKYYFLLMFLFLEIIALMLTISRNERSRVLFINSSNTISSVIYSRYYKILEYFSIREDNKELIEENLKLRRNFLGQKIDFDTSFVEFDTIKKVQYKYYSGNVVKNSVLSENNFITIDKGYRDGIEKKMGVVTKNGVVGIVVNVSKYYSVVLSVLNKMNGIGCKLKKGNYFGIAYWDGASYRDVVLEGIPNHIIIHKGDTVITSGYSTFFPEGILVGTIDDYKKNIEDNFYTITLKLAVDFKKLTNVYLIKNNLSTDQIAIEQETADMFK